MKHVQASVFSLSHARFAGCSPDLNIFHGKFEFLQEFDFVFSSLEILLNGYLVRACLSNI